jgi:hypothetical protein
MAGELNCFFNGTATLYALIRDPSESGYIWNGSDFVVFSAGDIATYDVPLTDRSGDYYSADFPSGIANGTVCDVAIYEQAGAAPATTDLILRSYSHVAGSATASVPTGEDLTTTARYKTYAGITVSTWDTKIGYLITAVSHAILNYCDRDSFKSTVYTLQKYNGGQKSKWYLFLRNTPITAISSVVMHQASTTDTETYSGSDFQYEAATGEIRHDPDTTTKEPFPRGWQNIAVTYTAGYASLPGDAPELELCAWKALDHYFKQSETNASIKREKIGDYEYENFPTMLSLTAGFSVDPALEDIRVLLATKGHYRPHVLFDF